MVVHNLFMKHSFLGGPFPWKEHGSLPCLCSDMLDLSKPSCKIPFLQASMFTNRFKVKRTVKNLSGFMKALVKTGILNHRSGPCKLGQLPTSILCKCARAMASSSWAHKWDKQRMRPNLHHSHCSDDYRCHHFYLDDPWCHCHRNYHPG